MAVATPSPSVFTNNDNKDDCGKIPFSNVVVRPRSRNFWSRKWHLMEVLYASLLLSLHVLCFFAPFTFTWSAFQIAFVLYVITCMFGMNLSYHRNLTHRSFRLPKWLEYFFAYLGALAGEGPPINWVSTHRFHHKYADTDQDPHSPINGFWFSHIAWVFDQAYITQKCGKRKNVEDLKAQWFYRFLEKTHIYHLIAFGFVLYMFGGLPYVVWGMGVRMVFSYHAVFLVNSACHIWGYQAWNTGDLSKNNWFVALLEFGEGWHNNHHAFEYSARHGLEWWQLDMTWLVIRILEYVGLAKDVKLPSHTAKQNMSFKNGEKGM